MCLYWTRTGRLYKFKILNEARREEYFGAQHMTDMSATKYFE